MWLCIASWPIVPVNDVLVEGTETVTLTVVDGAHYDLGAPVSGSIDILDQPIPIVTITAFDPTASETGPDEGVFRFTRVGDLSLALTVTYVRSGSAVSTTDFVSFGPSISFPAGAATVDRVVTPTQETPPLTEGSETVVLTLSDGSQYNLGASTVDSVEISDTLAVFDVLFDNILSDWMVMDRISEARASAEKLDDRLTQLAEHLATSAADTATRIGTLLARREAILTTA